MKVAAFVLFFVGVLTLALSNLGFGQAVPGGTPGREQSMEDKGTPPSPDAKKATGEITALDAKAGTLTVKVEGKELSLDAKSGDAKKSLEKIKIGDKVTVSYTSGPTGQLVAQSVIKAEAKAGDEKPKGEKAKESSAK